MKIGFSLSPGGLLFPYHIGVLSSLSKRGYVTDSTPLAGSSAGAIAVASHAVGVDPEKALNACIRISEKCTVLGGARGRLMPLLEEELRTLIPDDGHEIVKQRPGLTGLAYREIFPSPKNVLATKFDSKDDLMEAVCNSSMFPFFTSNLPFVVRKGKWPAMLGRRQINTAGEELVPLNKEEEEMVESIMEQEFEMTGLAADITKEGVAIPAGSSLAQTTELEIPQNSNKRFVLPRLVVDGFFTVPRDRFGCPIFPEEADIARDVTVSCFPHDLIGLTASEKHDQICPVIEDGEDMISLGTLLGRGATQASTAQEHLDMYERGCRDGTRWADDEDERRDEVNAFFASNLQAGPF
jgi:hypothetical protein